LVVRHLALVFHSAKFYLGKRRLGAVVKVWMPRLFKSNLEIQISNSKY